MGSAMALAKSTLAPRIYKTGPPNYYTQTSFSKRLDVVGNFIVDDTGLAASGAEKVPTSTGLVTWAPNRGAGSVYHWGIVPQGGQTTCGTYTANSNILTNTINGLSLINQGDIDTQALAGALSTGTHGTGATLGFTAAVAGGWVDQALSRFIDLIMAIPSLIFALVVLSVMPVTVVTLILVMGLLDSTRVFRLARAVAVDITVMDYVEAARLRGEGQIWIIFREVLPNALSPLVAEMGMRFIFQVLFISTLSFLGLGVQPPLADWGGIVKENKDGIVYGVTAALYPAIAIATLAISVNLVADWILNRTTSLKGGRNG